MTSKEEILILLEMTNPALVNYEEWLHTGMVCKDAGIDFSVWDNWSSKDSSRYHGSEDCKKHWYSFRTTGAITISTLAMIAKDQGNNVNINNSYNDDDDLDMHATIGGKGFNEEKKHQIIDKNWVRETPIPPCPMPWNPNEDLINFLLTLFKPNECVAYSMDAYKKENKETGQIKYDPKEGSYTRTRDEIIEILKRSNAPICDYDQDCGTWIRVNPFDGLGVKDKNITDYRHVLIESDELSLEKQYTILKELELPIATLVHSGKKSLHALVKIDAPTFQEYKKRVDFLWKFCEKNSFRIDTGNRNPSRLSRMPGIWRNMKPQYLIDTNIGKGSWDEWFEYIQDLQDNLPEMESLEDSWLNPPPLADELIKGVLRKGHKMLVAGPSKAGKSWSLIKLCIAIAEGLDWCGFKCTQGKVLYVNLELDPASCIDRFKKVYSQLQVNQPNVNNIDIWNLRGKSAPMDKLAPKLIRRALKKKYDAVVIDPIYKVLTGDENSADQMAHFCNQFDKVCTELKASTICCHHHSKGTQGLKRSGDRASGSGVFLRDPDAYIDLLPLEITKEVEDILKGDCVKEHLTYYLQVNYPNWHNEMDLTPEEQVNPKAFEYAVKEFLNEKNKNHEIAHPLYYANQQAEAITAWRIEGTLREFPAFKPKNMFFKYPLHIDDHHGVLKNSVAEGMKAPRPKKKKAVKEEPESKVSHKDKINADYETITRIYNENIDNGTVNRIETFLEQMEIKKDTFRNRLKNHPKLMIKNSTVIKKA